MKNLKLLLLGAFAILAGCKSSYVTSSWKAKEIEVKRYNKVLVLGLIKEDDRRLQEKMEEHLAGDLRSLGYNAVTSLQTFGPKAFDNLSEKEALDKLNSSELDAVITIVLLNKQLEQEFIPNNPVPQRQTFYYRGRFWNYYGAVRNQVLFPVTTLKTPNIFGKVTCINWMPSRWFILYKHNLSIPIRQRASDMNMEE